MILFVSALLQAKTISPSSVLHAFIQSGEIMAGAELGFGRILSDRR